jgi:hypothetical protein
MSFKYLRLVCEQCCLFSFCVITKGGGWQWIPKAAPTVNSEIKHEDVVWIKVCCETQHGNFDDDYFFTTNSGS